MQRNLNKQIIKTSYFLAILLHLLFLLLVTVHISVPLEVQPKVPDYSVPAYVYKGAITPAPTPPTPVKPQPKKMTDAPPKAPKMLNTHHARQAISTADTAGQQESVLDMSRDFLKQNQISEVMHDQQNREPMLLIGDQSESPDPLIRLLGRALSANFNYPKVEGNMGIRGRVVIGMMLHPEGYISNVQIMESSDNPDFDTAALYAVNSAPKVLGVDSFLSKPKFFVIGFIFE